jgi:hypothetical protein
MKVTRPLESLYFLTRVRSVATPTVLESLLKISFFLERYLLTV